MQNLQYDYLDERYQNLTILGNEEKKSTYLAKDSVSGQIVVKKYIQPESAGVYGQLQKLENPHLTKIYHIARKENSVLVIMEYVSGKTVEEWQKDVDIFSEEITINYVWQLLEGITEIHKKGIVHRDISPKNILISVDGVVKLLDFDIGRQYKESVSGDTTILGTIGYAAPEQFGFTQSDKRTDIYAVGVLMNVMLTGKLPKEQMCVNEKFACLIKNCTHIDPARRYQNAEEMQREIRQFMDADVVCDKQEQNSTIIPGFRTGKPWKMIIAVLYYFIMGIYSIDTIIRCAETPITFFLELLAVILYLWLSVLLALNFMNWMEKVPLIQKVYKSGRAGRIVLGTVIWIVFFYYGGTLEQYVKKDLLHMAIGTK